MIIYLSRQNFVYFSQYRGKKLTKGDVFIGYNADTAASVVLQICQEHELGTLLWHVDTDNQVVNLVFKQQGY